MTDAALRAITDAVSLGRIPAVRRRVAERIAWEQEMNRLSFIFGLPLDVTIERFAQRHECSLLSWRDLAAEIMITGEL